MSAPRTYRLADPEGGWWYHLPATYGTTYRLDGVDLASGWVHVDNIVTEALTVKPGGTTTIGWELAEGIAPSDQYPATLTLDQYRHLTSDDEGPFDGKVSAIYVARTEPRPEVVEPFELAALELAGRPADALPAGLTWVSNLPSELRNHKEFLHLFPGYLTGISDAIKAVAEAHGATIWTHSGWEVHKDLAIPGETYMAKNLAGRKVKKPSFVRAKLDLPKPPHRIDGANLAEAVATYEALRDRYVSTLDALSGVTACPTCRTAGVVPQGGAR